MRRNDKKVNKKVSGNKNKGASSSQPDRDWVQNRCNVWTQCIPKIFPIRNTNLKYLNTKYNSGVDNTGVDFDFDMPVLGVNAYERVGNRIMVKRVDFRMQALYADSSNMLRIALVRFPANTPTTGGVGYYFQGSNSVTATYDVYSYYTPYALDKEFEVLYEFTLALAPNCDLQNITREFSIDVNKVVAWSTTSNPIQGQLRMVLLSDSGVSPHPVFVMNGMVWYTDL